MRTLLAVVMVGLAACVHGPQVKDFPPAISPSGATATVRVTDAASPVYGELYAVDAAGMLLRNDRLLRIPWSRVLSIDIDGATDPFDSMLRAPTPAQRAKLALISRFPQGLDEPLLSQVLALLQQSTVEDLP